MRHLQGTQNSKSFALIGGGSTGPVLIIYLAKVAAEHNIDLSGCVFHLIDPNGFGNGGIAYGRNATTHILNTRRGEMSPWDVDKFHNYLLAIGREDNSLEFNLRSDYKNFLLLEFAAAKKKLISLGAQFVKHRKLAYVRKNGNGTFTIVDEHRIPLASELGSLPAQNIVLSVGYGPNNNFKELREYQEHGYVDSLYPVDNLLDVLKAKKKPVRIAVLGSAAALYDFVVACPLSPPDVRLSVFSSAKKGLEVRQVEIEHLLKDIAFARLKALPHTASAKDVEQAISLEFADAAAQEAGPKTWVAFRTMGIIGSILSELDARVAQQFRLSPFFKELKRLGGPTTAYSKAKLDEYEPQFVPVELDSRAIRLNTDGTFTIQARSKAYIVDCVINASGHGRHNSAILEDMKAHGLAEIDPHLGTLHTDSSGFRLAKSGIACIGPATHFGTDGLETFAGPAEKLANSLLENINQAV